MEFIANVVISIDRMLAVVGLNAYTLALVAGVVSFYPAVVGIYATRGTHNNPQKIYERIRGFPLGVWLFQRLIVNVNPFSKSIGFSIVEFTNNRCVLAMTESQAVRNPFRSIHAGALATFAETAGGLTVLGQLSRQDRFIPTQLNCTYLLKSRGRIFATCNYVAPTQPGRYEVDLVVVITNEAGEITCKAHLIGRLDIGEATASKKQT